MGKSVAISTSGSPSPLYSTGEQEDAGNAVTFPPPPPLELLFPPQPAAANASTPISMANSPSVPYLLKMDTSVARSLVITRKGGSIEAIQAWSNPKPRNLVLRAMPKVGLEPTRGFPAGFAVPPTARSRLVSVGTEAKTG